MFLMPMVVIHSRVPAEPSVVATELLLHTGQHGVGGVVVGFVKMFWIWYWRDVGLRV